MKNKKLKDISESEMRASALNIFRKCGVPDKLMSHLLPFGTNMIEPLFWPTDAPAYHSPEGWELEKKMTEERLRETASKLQRHNSINWYLQMAVITENKLYSRIALRLMEIDRRAD
jgi:hypothetical protein